MSLLIREIQGETGYGKEPFYKVYVVTVPVMFSHGDESLKKRDNILAVVVG